MKNFVAVGNILTLPAPSALASGDGILVGAIFGVAQVSVANGEGVPLLVTGVFELPKAASQAWTVGARVYWDNTARVTTTTATGNTLIGVAVKAVGGTAGETTGTVRLNGSF